MVDLLTLRRMNDVLSSLDPWSLTDEDLEATIVRLQRQRNRCLVELERLQAEMEARRQRRATRSAISVP